MSRKNKRKKKQKQHEDKYAEIIPLTKAQKKQKAKQAWPGSQRANVLDIAREIFDGTYYCVGKDSDDATNSQPAI